MITFMIAALIWSGLTIGVLEYEDHKKNSCKHGRTAGKNQGVIHYRLCKGSRGGN